MFDNEELCPFNEMSMISGLLKPLLLVQGEYGHTNEADTYYNKYFINFLLVGKRILCIFKSFQYIFHGSNALSGSL